jgi:hypothetical protein
MGPDLASLFVRIRTLLDEGAADPTVPLLTEMEHTLTDGYAVALELEAERLRLERRIGELAHSVEGRREADELKELAHRAQAVDDDVVRLRDALTLLQRQLETTRAVA